MTDILDTASGGSETAEGTASGGGDSVQDTTAQVIGSDGEALDFIITDAGRQALVNAEADGTNRIVLHRVVFGTGQYAPSASQTELVSPVSETTVQTVTDEVADNVIQVTAMDISTSAYNVYEVGVYGKIVDYTDSTVNGTEFLFAVYSSTDGEAVVEKSALSIASVTIRLTLTQGVVDSISFGSFSLGSVGTATEEEHGLIRLATAEEGTAGEAADAAITPASVTRLSINTEFAQVSSSIALYSELYAYAAGDLVLYVTEDDELTFYRSLTDANLGNDVSDESAWESIGTLSSESSDSTQEAVFSDITILAYDYDAGTVSGTVTCTVDGEAITLAFSGTLDADGNFTADITTSGWTGTVTGVIDENGNVLSGTVLNAESADGHVLNLVFSDDGEGNITGTGTYSSGSVIGIDEIKARLEILLARLETANRSAYVIIPDARAEGDIGTAGGTGFGVGWIDPAVASSAGMVPMTGCGDPESPWFGNYIHPKGGHFVCIPKFYVRCGYSGAANYASYGPNTMEICSASDYAAMSSTEQATGWFLHRAFYNAGAEQDCFFMGKYSANYSSSLGYMRSMPWLNATSAADISYAYNGITYARKLDGFNVSSVFMHSALAVLMMAHSQGATGPEDCAFWDGTYANRCNLRYDHSYDALSHSSLTGTTRLRDTGYLKNAHNGQASGVMDLRRGNEFMIGMTSSATSSTSNATSSAPSYFLLSRSADFAQVTGSYGSSTGAHWGTASNLSSSSFWDSLTMPISITSTSTDKYWQVTSASASAFTDPSTASGVNLFGVLPRSDSVLASADGDGTATLNLRYKHNMFPTSYGLRWYLFGKLLIYSRISTYSATSFRTARYPA